MYNPEIFFEPATRSLCIFGANESATHKEAVACLLRLSHHLPRKPLRLFLSGSGWKMTEVLSVLEVLALARGRIETNAFSTMEGPMLLLFLAGHRRFMLPHCDLRFDGLFSLAQIGFGKEPTNEASAHKAAEFLLRKRLGPDLCRLLTDRPELTSFQAIKLGLAESLVGQRRTLRPVKAKGGIR